MPFLSLRPLRRRTLEIFCGVLLLAASAARAAAPAGFVDTLVANAGGPTAIAFTPDGRLLIAQQGGSLRVHLGGSLLAAPALSIGSICTDSERGLLGVAVDPAFASNGFIYLFYTFRRPDAVCVNRVSRFTLPASNVVSPASELVLLDDMPSPAGNHNAGDVQFGRDGLLYVTIGDGGCDYAGDSGCGGGNDAARDLHVLTGKVLRITSGGGIPASNPFQGAGTARCNTGATTPGTICREIFATGLRNPFRMAFDPNAAGTRFFINDVGQGAWEEIDLGQAGADYGWNCREGAHVNSTTGRCSPAPSGMVDPVFEYPHTSTVPGTSQSHCDSITGGAFVPDGLWPGFDGAYLFGDFSCGAIFRLAESGGAFSAADFVTGLGGSSAVTLLFGPYGHTQALYYTTYAGGGQVRRIHHDAALDFFTLTPCRVVDTRRPAGPYGGPALAGGATRTFALSGRCGIPATARAVALNLTVAGPTAGGHLTAFASGGLVPPVSTINFAAGQARANNAVLGLGAAADLAVQSVLPTGHSVHLLIDVVGYFQ